MIAKPIQCDCPMRPGDKWIHCPRHNIKKYRRSVELCRQRGAYWIAWEEGRGPGRAKTTAQERKAPHGPGTELKAIIRVCQRILPWFDLSPRRGCGCQATARWMNQLGPDGCEAKMDLILKRLEDEAKARKLTIPFRRFAAERLVRYAIGRARKKEARNG